MEPSPRRAIQRSMHGKILTVPNVITLIALLLMAVPVQALQSDRDLPIHIEADSAVVDEIKGTSIYRGDVSIRQGTMLIEADEVEIHIVDETVIKIIASVSDSAERLAHYEQLPEPDEGTVYADARVITYRVADEQIELAGEASLQQLDDRFTGDHLHYDVTSGLLNLNSRPGDRINITRYPRPTEAAGSPADDTSATASP